MKTRARNIYIDWSSQMFSSLQFRQKAPQPSKKARVFHICRTPKILSGIPTGKQRTTRSDPFAAPHIVGGEEASIKSQISQALLPLQDNMQHHKFACLSSYLLLSCLLCNCCGLRAPTRSIRSLNSVHCVNCRTPDPTQSAFVFPSECERRPIHTCPGCPVFEAS